MTLNQNLTSVDRCIRVDEVCKLLGICRTSLWKLQKSGELTPTRFGKTVTFRESVITAFIEAHTETPPDKKRGRAA